MMMRPRRFQTGGANDGTQTTTPGTYPPDSSVPFSPVTQTTTPAAGGSAMPGTQTATGGGVTQTTTPAAGGSPSSTSTAPSGASVNYFSLTPAQQQAYGNGDPNYMQAGTAGSNIPSGYVQDPVSGEIVSTATLPSGMPSSYKDPVTGVTVTPDMVQNYWAPTPNPYGNPNQPTTVQSIAPGQSSPSTYLSPQSYAAQQFAYNTAPAILNTGSNAVQNQAIIGNAGLPSVRDSVTGQLTPLGQANVSINGQNVPWSSLTPMQQTMFGYYQTSGQQMPSDFMSQFQGPNVSWNSPSLNALTVPSGSSIVGGSLQSNPSGGTGGIASPGAFTSSAPAAGVGTGMGAAGTPAAPQTQLTSNAPMGTGGGLGMRRGGAMRAEGRAPMRIRPRRFQMGGMNPAGGGIPPGLLQLLAAQQGGVPGAAPATAAQGALAGGLPGGPGAAAMGAAAGAGQGTLPPGAPPGMAGPGMGGAQSPNQQWGQLLLGGAPGTGINQQTLANNPTAQQALYRAYLGQLGAGGFGGAAGGRGMAEGGEVRHTSIGHLSPAHEDSAAYRYQLDLANDHTPGSHPDRQWGLIAESPGRYARGGMLGPGNPGDPGDARNADRFAHGGPANPKGRPPSLAKEMQGSPTGKTVGSHGAASMFDSTKGGPGNLATHKTKMARGGRATFASTEHEKVPVKRGAVKEVVRRRPPRPAAPPPPPYHDTDPQDIMSPADAPSAVGGPPVATAAPSVPPPPGAPFAKGGAAADVCEHCGKAHGGSCKGMRRGGKFHGKKAKTVKRAEGGKWIQGAIKHPGALHEQLGVPQGEKIPAKKLARAAKAPGKLGRRARLAETLKGMNKAEGGAIKLAAGGAAKQRKGFPNTNPPPRPERFARGGRIRGSGAAVRGTRFSGIY